MPWKKYPLMPDFFANCISVFLIPYHKCHKYLFSSVYNSSKNTSNSINKLKAKNTKKNEI